jgi:2-amino-4-hydroxy-6-hydroxymethyldihydropteridine diphosphokinase
MPESPITPSCIYLSLGSNLGDRSANLRAAIAALPSANFHVHKVSSFYETEPVDYLDQPWFLNCVVEGQTELQPVELLRLLRKIEARAGSKKAFAKGPRLLDIDILLFGGLSVNTPELQVPHPRMLERRFVLAPLAEIAPQLKLPQWTGTVSDLLVETSDTSRVTRL